MLDYLVYDCETKFMANEVKGSWGNISGMGLASCVVYDSKIDEYLFFGPDSNKEVCKYFNNRIVIGFNNFNFDSKLLLGDDKTCLESSYHQVSSPFGNWIEHDIYLDIYNYVLPSSKISYTYHAIIEMLKNKKYRGESGVYNLKYVCMNTLGVTKNDVAENGPKYYKEGKFSKLFQYNLQDVRLTKMLYEFIIKYKYIVNGNYDIIKFETIKQQEF